MHDLSYQFAAPLWVYQGKGAWHFVTLPQTAADEIRFFNSHAKGFMPIAVVATTGKTTWKTSVFPDSKSGSFVLAIKKDVRKAENLREGDMVKLDLQVPIHG
jgi:Domain of unknown function (DUF1905)